MNRSHRSEQVSKGNELRKHSHLTSLQRELCYGTLLGDASISPRNGGKCRIKCLHGEKQKEYLLWKMKLLHPFILQENPTIEKMTGFAKGFEGNCHSFTSITHPDFQDMYTLFYSSSKKKRFRHITMDTMKRLSAWSILFWFLDDGCLVKDTKSNSFHTRIYSNSYSLGEHHIFQKWFWKEFGIEAKITFNSLAKCYYLRFNVKATLNFLQLFQPFIDQVPECMRYKILLPRNRTL